MRLGARGGDEAGRRRRLLRRVGIVLAPLLLLVVAAERSGLTIGHCVRDNFDEEQRCMHELVADLRSDWPPCAILLTPVHGRV